MHLELMSSLSVLILNQLTDYSSMTPGMYMGERHALKPRLCFDSNITNRSLKRDDLHKQGIDPRDMSTNQ